MSLFKTAVNDCISMVEYEYSDGKYMITHEEILKLCENIGLHIIYNKEVRDELYKENN